MSGRLDDSSLSRDELLHQLHSRYAAGAWKQRFVYLRKKWAWLLIVEGTKHLKRGTDIIVGAALLLLLSPLMLLVAACIKATDRGPILYISQRVGKWGREFPFPKFRSMYVNADQRLEAMRAKSDLQDSLTFKMRRDPRVTWIGRIIRKFSIDELPQLWCVLKGEMTLVGPRPPLPVEVSRYTLKERRRLDITPGLTCLWQVSGRSDLPFNRQVTLDIEYIQSQSIWLDLWILLKTVPAVILGKGAY
ncbi:MAG: sugar transferase [Chlamydiia bacterium]|nr:sugar transferase [Chlamydiia bacterium]